MKKLFFVFCFTAVLTLPTLAQSFKIAEPYGTSSTSGKLGKKSGQKYTYLYDTSLIQAIKLKDEQRIKMLMYAQVNPNEKNDEGFTPLYFAAQYSTPETLTLILDRGAKVNLLSKYNLTPLMAAAAAGRADNVKILLEYGADPNLLDDKELTALDHAFNNHQLEAAILLNPITTIKKPTMNFEELTDENMNGKAALEHIAFMPNAEVAKSNNTEDNNPAQEQTSPAEEETLLSIVPEKEPVYNPTLAEIDAKIAKTRQALDRLVALRAQIVASEQQTLAEQESVKTENQKPAKQKASAGKTKTTYSKTTTVKTTSTKTSSGKKTNK